MRIDETMMNSSSFLYDESKKLHVFIPGFILVFIPIFIPIFIPGSF